MSPSIERKLTELADRHREIALLLAEPDVLADSSRLRELSREHAKLQPLADALDAHRNASRQLADAVALLGDAELGELAAGDAEQLRTRLAELEQQMQVLLLPEDPRDDANLYLEIRAGTGGDEAGLFVGDLLRMYLRYAEQRGWRTEILSENPGEQGGFREVVTRVVGRGAFARLKFESGTHRVQRVPETEAQGRIHTSAATVAILPEPGEAEAISIDPADLRTDTYRASGAGGQHVNKTDSAIRITHLPSGVVVECQEERSQHKNRARALGLLKARLEDAEQTKRVAEQAASRRLQVGSGDRSQRIRTYNFPQGRVTDHRINLTLYRLGEILGGELDELVEALIREDRADALQALEQA